MKTKIGSRVLITEDCRDGGKATGQYGIYEGDFPLTVSFGLELANGETQWRDGDYSYDDYKSGFIKLYDGRPAHEFYKEWIIGQPKPTPFFAMPHTNPRIRLEDGSVIWGCQCWWCDAPEGVSLEQAQKQAENAKELLLGVAKAIIENA